MYHTYGPFGWGMGFTWFLAIVLLIIIIWLIIRAFRKTGTPSEPKKTAIAILEERYAKGEIDKKEFEERKETLKNS